jgi:hypothetical protein
MRAFRMSVLSICVALLPFLALADDWNYISPAADSAFRTQSLILPLSETAPEDVDAKEIAAPGIRFGQFRFGSFDSGRVAVAVIPQKDSPPQLYVDSNRDRKLAAKERQSAAENTW